ncbi:type I polyketide synthase [Shewanella gelidii]|uniref:SDR family NAD(P)-dependent oxidoreductase n=1 Tax=Shewanella gelidii TaxID=1642821 RepID=A0A917JMT4_9GAMM|nr:type I polyketide synthase [Shewanella gelidii]MCL1097289.1 phosphopantetheine-binding protein [Shewanella gelidii]GGI73938.1 hypothetical protein GCM10009332_09320 [Shewanella gelidii]
MSQTSKPKTQEAQIDKRLNKRLKDMPVAIVGMASIFANSRYLNKFWDLISEKIDAITEVPETHWQPEDYYDADKSSPDKSYCKRGGFMPEVDFNPMEFGLPPNILELTDTSQLLSLIVAKELLEDTQLPADYDRDKIGITLGVGGGQKISQSLNSRLQYPVLKKVFKNSGISDSDSEMLIKKFQDQYIHWEENSFPGSLGNVIAGRIANRLDLGGMNCVVDAACAGSLAAMRMALTELVEGRSEMMITGGTCTDNSPSMYMSFSKTPAFTTNETIQPFDIDSKGMMIGEGIGMVMLKRLEDAERDGDKIYSVIKGIGASSDGKFKSIYAPRPEGQAKALKRAYDDAGFEPHTVGLIEAHGTGTAAGDVAEFNGLKSVFGEENDTKQHIALGSVKSQIGHTKSTAGTAGLIKAALALHHKVLPATINVSQPSPKLGIEDSPFYLNTETRPWLPRPDGTPRRAGISSFGFGGTNFHIVLEEHTTEHSRDVAYRQRQVAQTIVFSAANKSALLSVLKDVQTKATDADLQQLAQQHGLRSLAANAPRVGFVAATNDELQTRLNQAIDKLQATDDASWQIPGGVYYRQSALVDTASKKPAKVAALFAGQGSQYLNMGRDLACQFPEMRQQLVIADKTFAANDKAPLSSLLYPRPVFSKQDVKAQEAQLTNTANAQTAIGAISMGLYQLMSNAGFNADMFAGHSFGELSALCAAGVISQEGYYQLAYARGAAMAAKPAEGADTGSMAAVITKKAEDVEAVEACIAKFDGVKVANYNAPTQLVIAGPTESVADAAKALTELGFKAISLPVSGAFHTPLVGHAQAPFAAAIDEVSFTKPKQPLYSNATGALHKKDARGIKSAFKQHMLQSVHFSKQLETMYNDGARVFVEFGPKNILQKLVENTLANQNEEFVAVSLNANPKADSDVQFRLAAVQLAVAGVELNTIDPYQAANPVAPKSSPMNIKLVAANYVSPATRSKMAKSLETGKISSQIVEKPVEKIIEVEKIVEKIVEVEKVVEVEKLVHNPQAPVASQAREISVNNTPINAVATQIVADTSPLAQFFAAQQQAAELHQQFLAIPQQYQQTVTTMMTEQAKLAAQGVQLPQGLQVTMAMLHQHQAQTLESHAQFLNLQAQSSQSALQAIGASPASPVAPAAQAAIQPVAAQAPMAQPQVQAPVIAAPVVQAPAPVTPVAPTPAVQPATPAPATPVVTKAPAVVAQAATPEPTVTPVAAPVAANAEKVMLAVVAEKTGYPTEMLDLEMDMEADLGIDSIKRVEILGTVQDELPNLPELSPEDLAECRTLGEIVTYMNSKMPTTSASASTQVTSAGLTADAVQTTMMNVVAEKTGYPTEMLDLGMDMEADLGIDSIKRVEILGTVQDELPSLPELSPEDLAECRTLGEIVDYMNSKLPAANVAPAAQAPAANASVNAAGLSAEQVQTTMMNVVAEKTGYPTEMLALEMDMEADLGIDSIKRVEILGTVQDELPGLPELSPEDLAECRTLGEIVDYMNSKLPAPGAVAPAAVSVAVPAQAASGLSADTVQSTMMAVVAEKTGYPTEMLALEMDMEADLGIDSIKRVEILGTVQDELPDLPELNPEDLAECRTLGEIVAYMNSKLPALDAAPVSAPTPATSGLNAAQVEKTMMSVVAEKTGYPTEMLALEMDMEADLGIDSIKRVEILGTVQDELPGLPELNPEDLAECRTLGEIVAYMNSKLGETETTTQAPSTQAPATPAQGASTDAVQTVMMDVVAEKTGYPAEMLALEMDMEADLGIDSIKRVEILGTVQDQLPELPELNPEDMSECRTLGEIVALFSKQIGQAAPVADKPAVTVAPASNEPSVELPPHSEVALKKLKSADKLASSFVDANLDLFAQGDVIVIADDGHNAGVLAEKLQKLGTKVAVVRLPGKAPQSPLSSEIASLQAADYSETAITQLIADIEKLGQIAGFIHLQAIIADSNNTGIILSDDGKQALEQAFLWAKHLQPVLTADAKSRRSFMTVSRIDGGFGYLDTNKLQGAELNQAALAGLTKTLSHEWPTVFCRALDISPEFDASQVADAIVAEIGDSQTQPNEVGISQTGRVQLVGTESELKTPAAELNRSDKILVTGGAKGVTFECALSLAKRCQSHFILAGRSEHLTTLPQWAEGKQASELKPAAIAHLLASGNKPTPKQVDALVWPVQSSLEISQSLAAFTAVGASAEYISMDVTNEEAIKASLRNNQVTGLIHGAGVLADKNIQDKTLEELGRVYGTKVNGLKALLGALDCNKLKLVAMFSSAAGFYGNTGQSDYSMSNEILNKAALQFQANHPQAKVMSFNWGPWDGGMVNPALKKMFTERGVYVIPLQAGAELFATQLLGETGIQLLVGTDMQGNDSSQDDSEAAAVKKLKAAPASAEGSLAQDIKAVVKPFVKAVQRTLVLEPQQMRFLEDHVIGGNRVLPTVCALQWMRQAAAEVTGQIFTVQDYKLLKGVVFESQDAIELTLALEPTTLLGQACIQALISAEGRPQYKATLVATDTLEQTAIALKSTQDYNALQSKASLADKSALYRDGTLFHGPRLQGLQRIVQFDAQSLIAVCQMPQVKSQDCGAFVPTQAFGGYQPFAEDYLLQAMLVWARMTHDAASLPSAIERFDSFSPLAWGEEAWLELDVVKTSSRQLQANVRLYHADGRISAQMLGAKVTVSKSINDAFLQNQAKAIGIEEQARG